MWADGHGEVNRFIFIVFRFHSDKNLNTAISTIPHSPKSPNSHKHVKKLAELEQFLRRKINYISNIIRKRFRILCTENIWEYKSSRRWLYGRKLLCVQWDLQCIQCVTCMGVILDGAWIGDSIYEPLTHSQLVSTAPPLISTIHKSPQHPLSLFKPAVFSPAVPWQRLLTVEIPQLHALKSCLHRLPCRNNIQLTSTQAGGHFTPGS
jgi:hypothetical protein